MLIWLKYVTVKQIFEFLSHSRVGGLMVLKAEGWSRSAGGPPPPPGGEGLYDMASTVECFLL